MTGPFNQLPPPFFFVFYTYTPLPNYTIYYFNAGPPEVVSFTLQTAPATTRRNFFSNTTKSAALMQISGANLSKRGDAV